MSTATPGAPVRATWNYQRYGKPDQLIHKSHLNVIAGEYGCPRRFKYDQDAAAAGERERDPDSGDRFVSGATVAGSAAHEVICRALCNEGIRAQLLAGEPVSLERVRSTFDAELILAASGRRIEWRKDELKQRAACVAMIYGTLAALHKRVHSVVLVEPAFVTYVNGYWLGGHIDLIYRPRSDPGAIALADWKTGLQRPHAIELDHSYEAAMYSAAMWEGVFVRRDAVELGRALDGQWRARCCGHEVVSMSRFHAERDCLERVLGEIAARWAPGREPGLPEHIAPACVRLGQFPSEIHCVHMRDYVPYERGGKKEIKRPEDLRHYGLTEPGQISYAAGDTRGPAWLPVRRNEHDLPRLGHRLRHVVGSVRMGRFIDIVGEHCTRCRYAGPCLNGGYAAVGDEQAQLTAALKSLDHDADSAALDLD
jgi:hypothetical protein